MPEMIKDGTGSGKLLKIDSENKMVTSAVSVSLEHHVNVEHGDAYNFLFTVTPSAGGCFFYMENTSTNNIVCEGMVLHIPSYEVITIKLNDVGTPVKGSDAIPANLNSSSSSVATGTFQTGNDITGLSGGTTVWRQHYAGGNDSYNDNFDADIIIGKNQTLTMYATNGSLELDGFIVMVYDRAT